ncbi:MAG: cyclic nucleotide-binding domain-containing protein [Chloroflexi bacterium]|nr:cyclic nucleotide-binding domain-containing protein [Chloroflexota bacterium]
MPLPTIELDGIWPEPYRFLPRSDGAQTVPRGCSTVKSDKGVAEAVLALLKPGDAFGEIGLIDGKPRSATVSALQPIDCYFLDRANFFEVLLTHPEIAAAMLPTLAAMVRYADRWVAACI